MKYPYLIDEKKYRRFDPKNSMLQRPSWDESLSTYGKWISTNVEKVMTSKKSGFGRLEFSMSEASWVVHDKFSYAFTWEGEEPSQNWKKKRFEIQDVKRFTRKIKKVAKFFGAAEVGITKVDEKWLYQGIELPKGVDTAIVILIEMDKIGISTSPSIISSATTGKAYSTMAFVLSCMGEFIRNLGYRAVQSGNDTALSIPLAIDAGLGALGRNGLLVTKKYGPRVRICKIFTDLPLSIDQPDYEFIQCLTNFCRTCRKCADACEKGAISFKEEMNFDHFNISNNPGVKKYYVNVEKCFEFWVEYGSDCSKCIAACPFSKIDHFLSPEQFWEDDAF